MQSIWRRIINPTTLSSAQDPKKNNNFSCFEFKNFPKNVRPKPKTNFTLTQLYDRNLNDHNLQH